MMWQLLRKIPMRYKLLVVNIVMVFVALTIACGSLLIIHTAHEKEKLAEEMLTQVQIVANYLTLPLSARHLEEVEKVLSSLSKRSTIVSATLFDRENRLFAQYRQKNGERADVSTALASSPYVVGDFFAWPENVTDSVIFDDDFMHVMYPVSQGAETIGHMYVRVMLSAYYQNRMLGVAIFIGVVLGSLLLSSVMMSRLATAVFAPIGALSDAIRRVMLEHTYSIRVEKTTEDELGFLVDRFNEMLVNIEQQHGVLSEHSEQLKQKLDAQDKDLCATRMELESSIASLREANKTIRVTEENKRIAEESVKTKATFLANMSHELRTPMNGVLGMLNMLSDSQLTQEQSYYARVALDSASALLAILDDILDLTKVEEGKLIVERIEFDLFTVLDDVFSVLGESAYKKNVELVWYCSGDVPAYVVGDPVRTKQIVYNVIGNAIKFTEAGYISLVLSASDVGADADFTEEGDQFLLSFCVTDTGIGIKKDAQKSIFDSFTQADNSTTRRFGGTGLGLALCKELTQLMGGGIEVRSEWGKGSVFSFSVLVERSTRQLETPIIAHKPRRILVLDDQTVSLMAIGQHLERLSIDFDTTASPALFLEKLSDRHSEYDLLAVDLSLREVSIEGLLEQIRQIPHYLNTPVIIMGSLAQRAEALINWGLQAEGYWIKPIRFGDIAAEVQKLTQSKVESDITECVQPLLPLPKSNTSMATLTDKTYHLLVVEDNKVNQQVAVSRLQRLGYHVDTADNGAIALEKLRVSHYDLVFMDCHMPILDGYETTKKIRQHNSSIAKLPIIAMTANAMSGDREHCLNVGMDDYLSKPVKNNELERILTQWLQ
ncbi:MAG: response regulator [Gammaproteobacteria bacterium]